MEYKRSIKGNGIHGCGNGIRKMVPIMTKNIDEKMIADRLYEV